MCARSVYVSKSSYNTQHAQNSIRITCCLLPHGTHMQSRAFSQIPTGPLLLRAAKPMHLTEKGSRIRAPWAF